MILCRQKNMDTNAVYQNVISSNCEIGDLRAAVDSSHQGYLQ